MKKMDTNVIEKFYSKLFRTPNVSISLFLIILTLIISFLFGFLFKYTLLFLILFIFTFLSKKYLKLLFDIKRILFFVALFLVFVELLDIIVVQLNKELIYVTPASMTALLTILFYLTSESSQVKTAFAVLVLSLLLSFNNLASIIASVWGIIIGNFYLNILYIYCQL